MSAIEMNATQVNVREITEYSSGVLIALEKLLSQLSKSAALPSENMARNIVDSECSRLLVAEVGPHSAMSFYRAGS